MKKISIIIAKDELDAYYIKRYQREEKYKTGISGYAEIIEDLGLCVGVGGIYDEYWYMEFIDQATTYAHDQFNFEEALLAVNDDMLAAIISKVEEAGTALDIPKGDGVHTRIASYALSDVVGFDSLVSSVRILDVETLCVLFPEYEKDREKAEGFAIEEMERDFIRGDYHGNFIGLNRTLEKEYNADDVRVEMKNNSVSFEWQDDTIVKDMLEESGYKRDTRLMKNYIISTLCERAYAYKEKERIEREARRAERERVAKYQAERKAKKDAERLAKIDAIRL